MKSVIYIVYLKSCPQKDMYNVWLFKSSFRFNFIVDKNDNTFAVQYSIRFYYIKMFNFVITHKIVYKYKI